MKILVFTEGTIIMHKAARGHSRDEIVKQSEQGGSSVSDYASYIPIGDSAGKLSAWKRQGAMIFYLTSRTKPREIEQVRGVLRRNGFPEGRLLFRKSGEAYKDIAERVVPDILIEDDCESIGGADEMTITHVRPEIRKRIKSIPVKEFGGIGHLPDRLSALVRFQGKKI